jgi:hypothetical protein
MHILHKLTPRQWLIIILLPFLYFLGHLMVSDLSNTGKTQVSIRVIPKDAMVYVNDKPSSAGDIYLKPGAYKISAKKKGFNDYTQTIEVGEEDIELGLIPTPQSEEAKEWLANNPKIQQERETIGGINANRSGLERKEESPIVYNLPVTDIFGPFSIDYGPSAARENGVYLTISDSSPEGRANAIKWIRQHNQDPTDLEIRYPDFVNPLEKKESQ